jgi:hypothetical protein
LEGVEIFGGKKREGRKLAEGKMVIHHFLWYWKVEIKQMDGDG